MSLRINIVGYDSANGNGIGTEILATVKNVAGAASLCGSSDKTLNSDPGLAACTFSVITNSTNAQVQVVGVLGRTINWKGIIDIVSVT